jgi:hypothetical protein
VIRRALPWLVLAGGALLPIARVLSDPLNVVTGTRFSDVHKHVWSYWHAGALPMGAWPHTPFLNAPGGGVLLDLLFLPAVLLAPVTAAFGPAASANLFVWLNLWATGAATYTLARALAMEGEPGGDTSDRGARPRVVAAALVAGLSAQTAPYMLGYPIASGVHERLMVWIFPLVVLAIWRCRAAVHAHRWTALATVGFFVTALGCQAYALYTAVLLLVGAPVWLGGGVGVPGARRGVQIRAHAARLAPLAAGLVVAGLVAWAHTRWLTESPWALVPRPDATTPVFGPAGKGQGAIVGASLASLLDPFTVRATAARFSGDQLYELVYLGWAPLLAAMFGAWRAQGPTRWFVRGAAALALLMVVLAVGPVFYVFGMRFIEPLSVAVSWIVPFYGTYPPLWQQAAAFAPLVAPAIAVGLARAPIAVSALVLCVILGERALVSPVSLVAPAIRLAVPAPYDAVGDGAVVDIPRVIGRTPLAPGLYFLAQTAHGQPMAATINPGNSAWDAYLPVLRGVTTDWRLAADCLRKGGLRWAVIHRTWFDDTSLAMRAASGLAAAAGPPVADDGDIAVFDLGIPAGQAALPPPTTQAFELMQRGWIGQPATAIGADAAGQRCPAPD